MVLSNAFIAHYTPGCHTILTPPTPIPLLPPPLPPPTLTPLLPLPPPPPTPPEEQGPQEERNRLYQALVQHSRPAVERLMQLQLTEIQNDMYDQHKRSLENEAKKSVQKRGATAPRSD